LLNAGLVRKSERGSIREIRRNALRSLIPPPRLRLRLSEWIEANIVLPEGTSALPGRVRLWPYQREIADAISDPAIERVTVVKLPRDRRTTRAAAFHFSEQKVRDRFR